MATEKYTPRLADKYKKDVIPALMKKFSYKTVMQAPRLTKICLNRGVNGAVADKKLIDISIDEMTMITGQKAVATMSQPEQIRILFFRCTDSHNYEAKLGCPQNS